MTVFPVLKNKKVSGESGEEKTREKKRILGKVMQFCKWRFDPGQGLPFKPHTQIGPVNMVEIWMKYIQKLRM